MVTPSAERRLVYVLAAVQFTVLLDFMVLMPLGGELMRGFSLSSGEFGALVSSYTIASAVAGVTGAWWLDRWERRRALLVLYQVFVATTAGCALAPTPSWLVVCRVGAGAAGGLLWSSAMALLADAVPPERRGSAIGLVMTSYSLSAVLGVPVGLLVAAHSGWRGTFVLIAALAAAVCFLLFRALAPSSGTPGECARRGAEPLVLPRSARTPPLFSAEACTGFALTFCVVFAAFLMIPYLGPFMTGNLGVEAKLLPWVYLSGGTATFFTSRFIGNQVDRHGGAPVLAVLLVATILPHLLITHLPRVPLPYIMVTFVLFMTLTSGRIIPTLTLIAGRVRPEVRGRFMALNTAVSDAASGVAAWVSGALLDAGGDGRLVGFGRVGWISVAITLFALSVLWSIVRAPLASAGEVEAS